MPGHPIVAAVYDRMLAGSEKAGLAQLRADLLAAARGSVLELGAGTGANLAAYPDQVESVTLIEPDPHMARRLRAKIAANPPRFEHELVEIGAERLPFGDHRFDTAVATLVLCTIPIPAGRWPRSPGCCAPTAPCWCSNTSAIRSALAAPAGRTARRAVGWVAGGCHPNRDTRAALLAAGFDVSAIEPQTFPKGGPVVKPMIEGKATRAGSAR